MPKYLSNRNAITIKEKNGNSKTAAINKSGAPYLDYESFAIKVNIEAGVNFRVQKDQAMKTIIALMQASPEFAQFINSPKGLSILLKNINIIGADSLREAAEEWSQQQIVEKQQQMQQAQQMMQQDPRMIKAKADMAKLQLQGQELQQKGQQQQFDNQIQIAKMAIEKELADAKILESQSKISQEQINSAVRLEEANTSLEVHALESASKMAEIKARHHDQQLKEHANMRENIRLSKEISENNSLQQEDRNGQTEI